MGDVRAFHAGVHGPAGSRAPDGPRRGSAALPRRSAPAVPTGPFPEPVDFDRRVVAAVARQRNAPAARQDAQATANARAGFARTSASTAASPSSRTSRGSITRSR